MWTSCHLPYLGVAVTDCTQYVSTIELKAQHFVNCSGSVLSGYVKITDDEKLT